MFYSVKYLCLTREASTQNVEIGNFIGRNLGNIAVEGFSRVVFFQHFNSMSLYFRGVAPAADQSLRSYEGIP